jgi:hypothetical protein
MLTITLTSNTSDTSITYGVNETSIEAAWEAATAFAKLTNQTVVLADDYTNEILRRA